MSADPLFAYGTLRDSDILAGVLGRDLAPSAIRPANAPGYRAVYCPGQVYPVLAIAPANTVIGQLLHGLTPADLAILDAFEGPLYYRATISVSTEAGRETAWTYLPITPALAEATPWSLEHWTLHHKPAALAPELDIAARARRDVLSSSASQG